MADGNSQRIRVESGSDEILGRRIERGEQGGEVVLGGKTTGAGGLEIGDAMTGQTARPGDGGLRKAARNAQPDEREVSPLEDAARQGLAVPGDGQALLLPAPMHRFDSAQGEARRGAEVVEVDPEGLEKALELGRIERPVVTPRAFEQAEAREREAARPGEIGAAPLAGRTENAEREVEALEGERRDGSVPPGERAAVLFFVPNAAPKRVDGGQRTKRRLLQSLDVGAEGVEQGIELGLGRWVPGTWVLDLDAAGER